MDTDISEEKQMDETSEQKKLDIPSGYDYIRFVIYGMLSAMLPPLIIEIIIIYLW